MSSQKEQTAEDQLDELHTKYYNDELSEDEYEKRLEEVIESADDSLDLDYSFEFDNQTTEPVTSESKSLLEYWPYGLIVILVIMIPLTRGRALIFAIPLLVIWFLYYAKRELSKADD